LNATLAVGLGGFIGSIARYRLGGLVLHHSLGSRFPVATLAVNLAGCLLVGLLAGCSRAGSSIATPWAPACACS
jgi:CrcB protein